MLLPSRAVLWWWLVVWGGLFGAPARAQRDPYWRLIAPTAPLPPAEEQKRFHLPPGFQIQLVAAEPAVRKPINLNFDARGRLLVSGSVEYPLGAPPGAEARDGILVLQDADRDGRFEQRTTLAGGLNIPVGLTPIAAGVLAYSIPNIDRLVDRDADGRADARQVTYGPFGCQDTHGMPNGFTWWIDGWIYACHGDGNRSRVAGADGQFVTLHGGSTFRMRPDGSRIEPWTHGQTNPFGLCFDPLGDMYTADSNSKPAYLLLRGAWYPGLGASHDGLGFGPAIMRHYHGSTGIAGIAYYAADQFPAEYRDTLFIGNPVTGRINHDRLQVHGSTYEAIEQPDFLTCDDRWFRPVDVKVGPDGALYIADFYNRVIAHSLVPLRHAQRDRRRGRIWRVVYRGPAGGKRARPVPDLTAAPLDQLLDFLRDPNLLIRTHATHQLVERIGPAAAAPLKRLLLAGRSHRWQRVHGLWVLQRLGALDEATIRRLAGDPDRAVRVHLIRALAERRDWGGESSALHRLVLARLSDPDAFVRRAAAQALARHPAAVNLRPLLQLWAETPAEDTLLVHAVRMALRDSLRGQGNLSELVKAVRAGPEDQRRLADVSLGIPTPQSAAFLLDHLRAGSFDATRLGELLHHVGRYLDVDSLGELYALARTFQQREKPVQATVLRSLYRAAEERGARVPQEVSGWAVRLARELLTSEEEVSAFSGIELAWDLKLSPLAGQLARLADKSSPQQALRSFAIDALGAVAPSAALSALERILLDPTEPLDIREKAADTLATINNAASRSLLDRYLTVAPAPVALVIARRLAHSRRGAELLLAAVAQGRASPRLLQDSLVDQGLRGSGVAELDRRLARLLDGLPPADDRLVQMIQQRRIGFTKAKVDLQRGEKVFEKNCSICHPLGGKGNEAGPALDGIGHRGLERILEDTLDPNQNVNQKYRTTVLILADGRIVTGLLLREEGRTVVLVNAEGKQLRLAAAQIESRRLSTLSPMPANAAEKIPEAEFYDLIGFLLSQRQP